MRYRFLDVMIYDYIIPKKEPDKKQLEEFFSVDITLLAKLAKNMITFLERATDFPKGADGSITEALGIIKKNTNRGIDT